MEFSRECLVGRWYRTDINEQGLQTSEFAELSIDGSFEFTFLTLNKQGAIQEQIVELGDWGLVGDIHFTITKNELIDNELYAADLADADNYHAYKVLTLNNKQFEYQHVQSKEVFILRRVLDTIAFC